MHSSHPLLNSLGLYSSSPCTFPLHSSKGVSSFCLLKEQLRKSYVVFCPLLGQQRALKCTFTHSKDTKDRMFHAISVGNAPLRSLCHILCTVTHYRALYDIFVHLHASHKGHFNVLYLLKGTLDRQFMGTFRFCPLGILVNTDSTSHITFLFF